MACAVLCKRGHDTSSDACDDSADNHRKRWQVR